MPLNTFFEDGRDFPFNGEAVLIYHYPGGAHGRRLVVFFRGSDVIVAGDVFVTTTYPVIDAKNGGSVDGLHRGLEPDARHRGAENFLQEGGTYVIPGHGRIGDEADVLEYRDMVVIIRDRIADMVKQGKTLEQVKAAQPTLDYDARYGTDNGAWTTAMFIEAVYND